MTALPTQTLGYPRIGRDREMKRALEAFWKGKLNEDGLMQVFWDVAEDGWRAQLDAGLDFIGMGYATLYDQMLDWAVRFNLIAPRFRELSGLPRYFAMARGAPGVPALDMTKWFDTNYHYLVPEIDATTAPEAHFDDFLAQTRRAQAVLGARAVPVVIGPVTLLRLSRLDAGVDFDALLSALAPLYAALLRELKSLGVPEVQLHEPVLVRGDAADDRAVFETTYAELARAGVAINLVTYFDDLGETYPWATRLPVQTLTLDFTRGDNLALLQAHGWPQEKTLAAGLVDARSVWRIRPGDVVARLDALRAAAPALRLSVSASLQFVPYSAAAETALPDALRGVLAFAGEKLGELSALARGDTGAAGTAWSAFRAFAPADPAVQARVSALTPADFGRAQSYAERRPQQVQLPPFPTTTIGSFPQTDAVRRLRARARKGEITQAEYDAGVDAFIAYTMGIQDALGLDVPVHGEFERSDMVEYFAEKLTGFAFTQNGWVQSFGSRYVRPPIIFADVSRPVPMTVREFKVAQSFTAKPVKGMLTGPVTILNWSYPRGDISRQEVALQLALALRDEIGDLEAAGARIIQVDEPALREGLPLKRRRRDDYLTWAVDAFRLATGKALPQTQIHTHMCYSEFGDILDAIDRLDADVISIENARSGDEMLRALADYGYPREVGPGVYDIHSPVTPSLDFITAKLRSFVQHLSPAQIWVNPDCGLKTRAWAEVIPALKGIMAAVQVLRDTQ
ncbi:MAG: 5-methyltetrahydropteroyltriglutamate--homocysteine S-methyltransferase [Anaerolineae bacterium]|nr:5-methyltetrahydropteroyltriglutamate--homocysteine S-methyltransferase [Anaerolineae bacterium]